MISGGQKGEERERSAPPTSSPSQPQLLVPPQTFHTQRHSSYYYYPFSIRRVIWILASDTVFVQLNQYSQILRRQCCLVVGCQQYWHWYNDLADELMMMMMTIMKMVMMVTTSPILCLTPRSSLSWSVHEAASRLSSHSPRDCGDICQLCWHFR